ncbi:unnamed protein product [Parnassius apollo]|uniref:(apollo) hypothetical protein n=1 Tax=Parnassius apollo TaxID=110799 RepID=A0A8S3WK95_PARAO|nr:unnamed protein product [Parnassius apollo]
MDRRYCTSQIGVEKALPYLFQKYSSPASTLATASTSSVSEKNIALTSGAITKIAPTPSGETSTSTSDSSVKLTTTVRFSSTPSQQELISRVSKLENLSILLTQSPHSKNLYWYSNVYHY